MAKSSASIKISDPHPRYTSSMWGMGPPPPPPKAGKAPTTPASIQKEQFDQAQRQAPGSQLFNTPPPPPPSNDVISGRLPSNDAYTTLQQRLENPAAADAADETGRSPDDSMDRMMRAQMGGRVALHDLDVGNLMNPPPPPPDDPVRRVYESIMRNVNPNSPDAGEASKLALQTAVTESSKRRQEAIDAVPSEKDTADLTGKLEANKRSIIETQSAQQRLDDLKREAALETSPEGLAAAHRKVEQAAVELENSRKQGEKLDLDINKLRNPPAKDRTAAIASETDRQVQAILDGLENESGNIPRIAQPFWRQDKPTAEEMIRLRDVIRQKVTREMSGQPTSSGSPPSGAAPSIEDQTAAQPMTPPVAPPAGVVGPTWPTGAMGAPLPPRPPIPGMAGMMPMPVPPPPMPAPAPSAQMIPPPAAPGLPPGGQPVIPQQVAPQVTPSPAPTPEPAVPPQAAAPKRSLDESLKILDQLANDRGAPVNDRQMALREAASIRAKRRG